MRKYQLYTSNVLHSFFISFLLLGILVSPFSTILGQEIEGQNPRNIDHPERTVRSISRSRQTLSFQEFSSGLPTSGSYNCVVIEDFNNDSSYDLIFGAEDADGLPGPTVTGLYAYTGNGGINWTNTSAGLWRGNDWAGIDLVDADEDGYMEYYATDENHGQSNSSGVKVWEFRNNIWTDSTTHVSSPLTSARPFGVQLENVSGDSRLDIVIANGTGMKYFENLGGNPVTWGDKSTGLPTSGMFTAVDIADMNKDGLADLVFCDYSSNEYLYIQNTSGGFHWSSYSAGFDGTGTCLGVELEDVNNDTHMDIVFGCRGSGIYCVLGNSGNVSGTSFSWVTANSGLPSGQHYYDIKVVDIDLDGDMDIIAPSYSNIGIRIYLGNGNTNPGTSLTWSLASNTNLTQTGRYISVDCEDINKDGSLDIAATSWGSGVHVWLNNLTADIKPPGAIIDLTVKGITTNSILVNWTAPADNATNVSSGPVNSYDIRYSTSMITSANWVDAFECVDEPTPALPGTVQEYNITGLQPGTLYYIVMRSVDERPNYSPLSNVVSATTIGIPDLTPPSQIRNLQAINPTNNSINLTWSAPADNGSNVSSGAAIGYEIRVYSALISNLTWDSSTVLPNSITPAPPGTTETFMVTNLQANTTYYFAIKAFDEVPNIGWISNSAFNTTLPNPDITPPNAVLDLSAIDPTETTINLTWNAPGDDGDTGTASEYDIRYSLSTITELTWSSSVRCLNEPVPQAADSTEHFQVAGLTSNTTYYFALKVADDVPSWSGLSNVAFNTTMGLPIQDTTAPGRITDLAASQPTYDSITLTWTAPGDDGLIGTATSYDLRYEKSSITEATWDFATKVQNLSAPKPAGENESFTVTGLESNTTYYFAIKASDDVPHWSPLSNVASETTLDESLAMMNATMVAGKSILDSGETTNLVITVYLESPSEPVQEASVVLSSNNPSVTITPTSSLTGPDGKLTVVITASEVTSDTEVTIYADITKLGFASLRREVTITIKQVVVTEPDFNLRITQERIKFSKAILIDGDKITISANITNIGITGANEFTVRFFLDSQQLGVDHQFLNLQVNDFIIVETPWTAVVGEHTIKVEIIPLNPNYESDESDNTAEVSFEVKAKGTDGDGKEKTSSNQFLLWLLLLIIIVIIILILVFVLVRKKRTQELMTTGAPMVDEPVTPSEMTGTIDGEIPEATEDFQEPMAEEFETPATVIDAPQDGVIAEVPGEPPTEEPAVPMEEMVISDELEAAPEPELPPQEPGETPMEGALAPAPDVSESTEEQPIENELEQAPQQMMCPLCQNLIPPNTTPCPGCGAELDWS